MESLFLQWASGFRLKRVIGLPGETVEIVDGKVYINGSDTPLEEPYLPEPMEGSYGPYTVPEGSYFMLGDNRNNSRDARYWENKFVKKEKIIAKVLFCYYPLSQFGRVNYDFADKYLFEFNLRRDGSSRFGSNFKYGIFRCLWWGMS